MSLNLWCSVLMLLCVCRTNDALIARVLRFSIAPGILDILVSYDGDLKFLCVGKRKKDDEI
jgi:hypothetical protein